MPLLAHKAMLDYQTNSTTTAAEVRYFVTFVLSLVFANRSLSAQKSELTNRKTDFHSFLIVQEVFNYTRKLHHLRSTATHGAFVAGNVFCGILYYNPSVSTGGALFVHERYARSAPARPLTI
jgi:hypothetical protein